MATIEQVAAAHHRRQQLLAKRTAERVAQLWRQVDPDRIVLSWHQLLGDALTVVSSAQGIAAAASGVYVDDALEAQGITADAEGRVAPAALSGVASDGRGLASLLEQPSITALTAIKSGATVPRSLTAGHLELDMIVRTQVADAGRVADGVAATARPKVTGYVRMVSAGACSRCIVLAGKHFGWNAGFLRHPQCQCRHIPVAENIPDDLRTDPRKAFDAMSKADQDKTFTAAGAQAIRDGADMNRVVNARRGMYTAGGRHLTTEAATRRGVNRRVRLMPEQIYAEAKGDRAEAIRLLRSHGYLTGAPAARVAVPPVPIRSFADRTATAAAEGDALAAATFGLDRRGRPAEFTPAMSRAVNTYTGSEYNAINRHLRGLPLPYGYQAADVAPTIRDLDAALAASRLSREAVVYRGVVDAGSMFGDRLAGNLTGMQWREDAYLSSTARERKAAGFAGGGDRPLVMRILAPSGTQAIGASGMDLEAELLLRRGLRLRVVADRGVDPRGVRHIDVEVLGA